MSIVSDPAQPERTDFLSPFHRWTDWHLEAQLAIAAGRQLLEGEEGPRHSRDGPLCLKVGLHPAGLPGEVGCSEPGGRAVGTEGGYQGLRLRLSQSSTRRRLRGDLGGHGACVGAGTSGRAAAITVCLGNPCAALVVPMLTPCGCGQLWTWLILLRPPRGAGRGQPAPAFLSPGGPPVASWVLTTYGVSVPLPAAREGPASTGGHSRL